MTKLIVTCFSSFLHSTFHTIPPYLFLSLLPRVLVAFSSRLLFLFSPLLFIISPLLCLSTPCFLLFLFPLFFSFCRPLFHLDLLYFFIALTSHVHSLIRSFFSFLCVFILSCFFRVFSLCVSFLFIFFCPCPVPCLVPSSLNLYPTLLFFKTFGLGQISNRNLISLVVLTHPTDDLESLS